MNKLAEMNFFVGTENMRNGSVTYFEHKVGAACMLFFC
jgi:hypothetical protein